MLEIIPAILPKGYEDMKDKLALVLPHVSLVHLDFIDGIFNRNVTWPYRPEDEYSLNRILNQEEGLPFWENINFEFDLMVKNAHHDFDKFAQMGASRLIFHIEAFDNLDEFAEFLEGVDMYTRENLQIGIALNTTTSLEKLKPLVSKVDFVQCMGIEHIGRQGEPFDERVLNHVRDLRKEFPELTISADGAVNIDSAPKLIEAGVNRLVVGSAIFESYDIGETIDELYALGSNFKS